MEVYSKLLIQQSMISITVDIKYTNMFIPKNEPKLNKKLIYGLA